MILRPPFRRISPRSRQRERGFVSLFGGCGGQSLCYGFRGIVGSCQNDNDGVNANMLAYLNAYDMTTIPWGTLLEVTFSNPSLTAPDNQPLGYPISASNPGPNGISQWFVIQGDGTPNPSAQGVRSQVWWPAGSNYGVYAVDSWNIYQTAYVACTGVTGACGGNILEIPIPNSSLPSGVPWNRIHYVAALGLTPTNIQQTYINGLAFGKSPNYGAGQTSTPSSPWNVNQVCYPSPISAPDDPFDGGIP